MRLFCYAEHTTRGGDVYTGDDIDWASKSSDVIAIESESREELLQTAAEWASRSGAVNQHTIKCGRNILDHLDVIEESDAAGIIDDLGLDIGTASLAWCRVAMDLADDDTISPRDMMWISSDPRRHTHTSLRAALLMLGCTEQERRDD